VSNIKKYYLNNEEFPKWNVFLAKYYI